MKIIQITADEYRLYGLTEDGEVWQYEGGLGSWSKLPPLPAESDAEDEDA
jgi:hypothetical protein